MRGRHRTSSYKAVLGWRAPRRQEVNQNTVFRVNHATSGAFPAGSTHGQSGFYSLLTLYVYNYTIFRLVSFITCFNPTKKHCTQFSREFLNSGRSLNQMSPDHTRSHRPRVPNVSPRWCSWRTRSTGVENGGDMCIKNASNKLGPPFRIATLGNISPISGVYGK